jgi:hypothetical protein
MSRYTFLITFLTRSLTWLAVLTLAASSVISQTPPPVSDFDPGINVGIELNRRVRLDFYTGRENTEELATSKFKVGGGASFRMKPLFQLLIDDPDSDKQHVLVIGGLYEFARASESGVTQYEHKLMGDVTGRWAFYKQRYVLTNRGRFEFRWLSGNHRFRFRDRLMLEKNMSVRKLRLTPYVAAEAYWDKNHGKWNVFKFTGGSTVRLFRRTSLDLFYERSHCSTCAYPHTNVLGAAINIFFKCKK